MEYIRHKARDSGPYRVLVDDEVVSEHTTERIASEEAGNKAIELAYDNPESKVHYDHKYEVDVTINTTPLTMKAVSGTLTPADGVPDPFESLIIDQTNVPINSLRTSAPFTPIGVDSFANSVISVDVGEYSLNAGLFTSTPGVWVKDDEIRLKNLSSGINDDDSNQVCTIGGVSGTFTTTTIAGAGAADIVRNFNGTLGAVAEGPEGWDDVLFEGTNPGTFSNDIPSVTGSGLVCKFVKSPTGTQDWGGQHTRGVSLPSWSEAQLENREIWWRFFIWFEVGFTFDAGGSEGMKFMRYDMAPGSSAGYHQNYIANANSGPGGKFYMSGEPRDSNNKTLFNYHTNAEMRGPGFPEPGLFLISTGEWHCFEYYVKFSSTPGIGKHRVWHNGNLEFKDDEHGTMNLNSGSSFHANRLDRMVLFSFWNDNPSSSRTCYVDYLKIHHSSIPSDTDIEGTPMIGTEGLV